MSHKFPGIKWHTFMFSFAAPQFLSETIAKAEEMGAEFLQLIPSQMEEPRSVLMPTTAPPRVIHGFQVLVRMPKDAYDAEMAKRKAAAEAAKVTP